MLITRNIIRRDISFRNDKKAFHTIAKYTNAFKHMLFEQGAKKGDLVALSIIYVNEMHIAALMACAELGLRVILLDGPASEQSLKYTKLAIHGPADFCIDDEKTLGIYQGLHTKMIRKYSKKTLFTKFLSMYEDLEDFTPGYDISEDDPFVVSSTSGSTRQSRKIEFSHKEVLEISKRAVDIFRFTPESRVMHTRNLHHASALFTSLFPALMTCKFHWMRPIPDKLRMESQNSEGINLNVREQKITHLMMSNADMLKWFLEYTKEPFEQTLIINMSGFTMTEEYIEYCKKYNLQFVSHYGSIDTAIPLLVNNVHKNTKHKGDNYLGQAPDRYYSITLNDGQPIVMCQLWSEPRKMDDVLELDGPDFYHVGRKENTTYQYYLDEAERLGVDLFWFFQDTKLNMEQLRGHIHEIKKSGNN